MEDEMRRRKERGSSSVEYIILLVLVTLTQVAVFRTLGNQIKSQMTLATEMLRDDVTPQ
jgi:Flp pilus assembly pilin Flp